MSRIAYLHHWSGPGPAALTGGAEPPAHCLPLYQLHETSLEKWQALLLPAHADQRYLTGHREQLDAYLQAGGTLVVNGHVAYPFLSCLQPFMPTTTPGLAGLRVQRQHAHPIFDGVDAEHLTFRRGVAGFYARGSNPPPEHALILNTLGPDQMAIDWLLTLPGGGRLLMHSGNDLWMYAGSQDSTGRLLPQLFAWLHGDKA